MKETPTGNSKPIWGKKKAKPKTKPNKQQNQNSTNLKLVKLKTFWHTHLQKPQKY